MIRKVSNVEYRVIILAFLAAFIAGCDEASHLKFFSAPSEHEPRNDCTFCHGTQKIRGFSPPSRLIEGVPKLCYKCHTDFTSSALFSHRPVVLGQCLSCHHAHTSRNEHLLKEPAPNLCYQCHVITNYTRSEPFVHVHPPVNQCLFCHNPHNGNFDYLLKEPGPKICYQCHDIARYADPAAFVHGPVAAGRCVFCHDAHTSRNEHLLKEPAPKLCYQCHDKKETGTIPAHREKPSYLCTDCHHVHTGSIKHLLKEEPE